MKIVFNLESGHDLEIGSGDTTRGRFEKHAAQGLARFRHQAT
jgi:hypothetical protein